MRTYYVTVSRDNLSKGLAPVHICWDDEGHVGIDGRYVIHAEFLGPSRILTEFVGGAVPIWAHGRQVYVTTQAPVVVTVREGDLYRQELLPGKMDDGLR